eukprot:8843328-Karenia_brevis.AAC.1
MGWGIQFSQGQIRLKDNNGDMWQPNPQYGVGLLRSMLEEAIGKQIDLQTLEHRLHSLLKLKSGKF